MKWGVAGVGVGWRNGVVLNYERTEGGRVEILGKSVEGLEVSLA